MIKLKYYGKKFDTMANMLILRGNCTCMVTLLRVYRKRYTLLKGNRTVRGRLHNYKEQPPMCPLNTLGYPSMLYLVRIKGFCTCAADSILPDLLESRLTSE